MKTNLFAIICLWLAVSSCEYNDIEIKCYHGKIIMSSCCTGTTFIDIDPAFPIGKATKLNDQDYQNVIQVPGYLTDVDQTDIYLNLHKFDAEKDKSLFPNPHCYCLIAVGMDVPMWVATAFSYSSCPQAASED